jgi:hypothetical protein
LLGLLLSFLYTGFLLGCIVMLWFIHTVPPARP